MRKKSFYKIIPLSFLILITLVVVSALASKSVEEGSFTLNIDNENLITLKADNVKQSTLISEISRRFGGEIKLYDEKITDTLVTLDIQNQPLDLVLRNLLKENYAFVTNTQGTKLGNINLFQKGGEEQTIKYSNKKNNSDAYKYPLTPKNKEEWKKLLTYTDKVKAVKVPDETLLSMSNQGLIETCLTYPLFINITAYSNEDQGFKMIVKEFNGFQELFQREGVGSDLLKKYEEIEIDKSYTDQIEKQLYLLETILAEEHFIKQLSKNERYQLARLALDKYYKREKLKDQLAYGIGNAHLIMAHVMEAEGKTVLNGRLSKKNDQGFRELCLFDEEKNEFEEFITQTEEFVAQK